METSTIAAIATPFGTGGIGIIKVSGTAAIRIARSIFSPRGFASAQASSKAQTFQKTKQADSAEKLFGGEFKAHHLYHGYILDPSNGQIIDEVLLSVMKAPRTYTREDVVEINAHSGLCALQAILNLVLRNGARLAEPGEFTKRAFLNGRIDLTQAEAVIDLINARTQKELQIANSLLSGSMRAVVLEVRRVLREVMAEIEAGIDFPEEIEADTAKMRIRIQEEVIGSLQKLLEDYRGGAIVRQGLKVAIVGKPNVGKSSLMNQLLQKERVIVTEAPGTTRDLIEETFNLKGIPMIVTDTAGLHETLDPVELLGIQKVHDYIEQADMILFMVDISRALDDKDLAIYRRIANKNVVLVQNKVDLVPQEYNLKLPDEWQNLPHEKVSALFRQGIERLMQMIFTRAVGESGLDLDNRIVPNSRHAHALQKSLQAASVAEKGIKAGVGSELIALDIQEALSRLGEIIGATATDEVLDQIFSQFCIGK